MPLQPKHSLSCFATMISLILYFGKVLNLSVTKALRRTPTDDRQWYKNLAPKSKLIQLLICNTNTLEFKSYLVKNISQIWRLLHSLQKISMLHITSHIVE